MTEHSRSQNPLWQKTYAVCFAILIASLPLSYQPLIHLGAANGANYDLSLIYIAMGLLVAVALPSIWQDRRRLLSKKYNLFILLFFIWNVISIVWSANTLRGTLTSSLIGLGTLLFFSVQTYSATLVRYRHLLLNTLKIVTVVLGLFCLYQLFGDAAGLSVRYTLLPIEYTSHVFGFARVTGFSAEPEFLGSLLLLPLGIFAYLAITKKRMSDILLVGLGALLITLTLSRGAFIGAVVVIGITLAFYCRRSNLRQVGLLLASGFLGVILGIGLFSLAAGLNTRDDISAHQAFSKAVSQVSLGTINPTQTPPTTVKSIRKIESQPSSGYVASSTTSRLQMSNEALGLLIEHPSRFLYGVGVGGFGVSLHQKSPNFSKASIVNNQYIEILTELGIVGLVLFGGFFYTFFRQLIREKYYIFISIIVGTLIQWLFFSGYPNILHIWPILGAAIIFAPKAIHRERSSL